jgi:RsiW-degrading membrane proteinase PrsW (M82 family)
MIVLELLFFCFFPPVLCLALTVHFRYLGLFSAIRALFFGLGAVLLASGLQWAFDPVSRFITGAGALFFAAFFEAALIEESAKLTLAACLPGRQTGGFDSRSVLSSAFLVGLSFASFETLIYSLNNPSILLIRSVTAVPLHACSTLVCCSLLLSHSEIPRSVSSGLTCFTSAVVLHGAYNICMEAGGFFLLPGYVCLLVLVALSFRLWKSALKNTDLVI